MNLTDFGFQRSQAEDRELFRILDSDGDGELTAKELIAEMNKLVHASKTRAGLVEQRRSAVAKAREAAEQAQTTAVAKMCMGLPSG